jgi:hypothetical protein
VWIAAAEDVAVDDPHLDVSTMLELSILACEDWTCRSSTYTALGRSHSALEGPSDAFSMGDRYESNEDPFVAHAFSDTELGPPLELSLDSDGVPFIVHSGWASETLATCGTPECSAPSVVEEAGGVGAVPIGGISDGVVGISSNLLTYCPERDCEQRLIDGAGTLLAVSESGIMAGDFGLVAVMSEPVLRERDGVDVSINVGGAGLGREASWRTVLLYCDDYVCSDARLIPIGVSDHPPEDPALMVEGGAHVRLWYTTGWDEHEVELTLN